jgi:hypothetical protein
MHSKVLLVLHLQAEMAINGHFTWDKIEKVEYIGHWDIHTNGQMTGQVKDVPVNNVVIQKREHRKRSKSC